MPELPEVEVLRQEMTASVVGRRVVAASAKPGVWDGAELLPRLVGVTIVGVRRRGKALALDFDNGLSLAVHLMLLGQALLVPGPPPQGAAIALRFDDGDSLAVTQVALKFEHLLATAELEHLAEWTKLGPDALDPELTPDRLRARLARRGPVKALLMDQGVVAGLGNVYADEILFAARVHPKRDGRSLSVAEVAALHAAMTAILRDAVAHGGAGIDAVVRLDGSRGRYQEQFKVARREGEPCPNCGGGVAKMQLGGRATYFCPACQPV